LGNLIDVSKFDKIISVLPNYASIDKLQSIEGGGVKKWELGVIGAGES